MQAVATLSRSSQAQIKPLISEREKEVLHLIAYEHSSKEIAKLLYISHETVYSHRKNIMSKLGVKNMAGMIREAMLHGLIVHC